MEHGWSGPPYDPAKLAGFLNIRMVPTDEVTDARTVPLVGDRLQIEFNPNKPKARVRFSIAHEIAHSLFPDCSATVRHRHLPARNQGDEWQLEMLCNLGAAEFLMPVGSFPSLAKDKGALKAYLRRHGLVVADLESGETECQHLFPNVKNLIEWYHSRFSSVAPPVDLSKKLASRELSAALDSVKRGAIWLEKIEEPEFFVLKLKKNSSSLDCKARIAAILSLWHTAAMTRPL